MTNLTTSATKVQYQSCVWGAHRVLADGLVIMLRPLGNAFAPFREFTPSHLLAFRLRTFSRASDGEAGGQVNQIPDDEGAVRWDRGGRSIQIQALIRKIAPAVRIGEPRRRN